MNNNEILLLTVSTVTSALLMPNIDKTISDTIREEKFHKNSIVNAIMKGGDIWGFSSLFVSLLLLLLMENKHVGMNTLKATVIGVTVSRGLTIISGRHRPNVYTNDSMNFNLFKGLKYSLSSLPSGHATVAFAFAAAADNSTPNSMLKTIILYSMAGITALSRVYHNKHWLSDVIMGSTIGYLIGSSI